MALVQHSSPRPSPARAQVVTSFYLVLALAGFLWHAVSEENNDCWREPGVTHAELLWTPLVGIGLGLAVVAAFRVFERRWLWLPMLHREFRGILGRPSWTELLLLAAASSIGEEIFFRGAMLDAWGPWLSSLVFALLHVPPRRELWPWTVSAGLLGLCLAGLTLWTGNLGPAVAAHFVINMINLAYITRRAPAIAVRGRIQPRRTGAG
ncbi:CAAX amino terminal protease self- immunity [Enhygromyxa salina]|uniref:CAAX amino terminal protease self-immunity n=1 Tax=Enhygromyxa salina TaxID=215803 RepID=A0A2S9YCX6_9BACT|nr:type II CAAX endopeptidase family protein [Enhygromyxa salina]PRQ02861.1 CAAX amino terminal protease self- immunity [Enhygromyxa salina]